MRLTTIASIVLLGVSTAALAQVATAPSEQKIPADNSAAPDDTMSNANTAAPVNTAAPGNGVEAAPGAPSTALVNSTAGKPPK